MKLASSLVLSIAVFGGATGAAAQVRIQTAPAPSPTPSAIPIAP